MTNLGEKPSGLVADADVLIDYAEADKTVLALISRHLAPIYSPSNVFEEVRKLSAKDAGSLGIVVLEPELDQAMEAQAGEGTTSFQDRLCFVIARDAGWSVLTNDNALRKACTREGVPCVWGLEAMAILVDMKHMTAARAMSVAQKMARANHFLTNNLLEQFRKRIGLP